MKNLFLSISIAFLAFTSCTPDDPVLAPVITPPAGNIGNTTDLMLFAIDTAKVVTMTETGTNQVTVLNRKLNQNSYISDFCFSPDGSKFIYVETQSSGVVPNFVRTVKLKIANANGTGDTELFNAQNALQGSEITSIRYCSDNKIFFIYKMATSNGSAFGTNYYTINPDGTGSTILQSSIFGTYVNVSDDRRFFAVNVVPAGSTSTRTLIYDKTLDGGAGGLYTQETFTTDMFVQPSSITNDGKLAVIPFKDGNDLKVKIITMATKAVVTKTIVSGLAAGWVSFRFNMASDSVRGVLTVTGQNYLKSKSYIFNTTTGAVSSPFENNDTDVLNVYAY